MGCASPPPNGFMAEPCVLPGAASALPIRSAPTPPPAPLPSTVRTRILILSDTHGKDFSVDAGSSTSTDPRNPPLPPTPLPSADVLLHCGDLTRHSGLGEWAGVLAQLRAVDAPLRLVIPGNHDIALDETGFPAWSREVEEAEEQAAAMAAEERAVAMVSEAAGTGGAKPSPGQQEESGLREAQSTKQQQQPPPPYRVGGVRERFGQLGAARRLWAEEEAAAAPSTGRTVLLVDEGVHVFELRNGARLTVFASPWTPRFGQWGFQYPTAAGHVFPMDGAPVYHHFADDGGPGREVGIAPVLLQQKTVGGGAAKLAIDVAMTHGPPRGMRDLTTRGVRAGCPHLLAAVSRARPLLHCFGHIHEGWGAERVSWLRAEEGGGRGVGGGDGAAVVEMTAPPNGRGEAPRNGKRRGGLLDPAEPPVTIAQLKELILPPEEDWLDDWASRAGPVLERRKKIAGMGGCCSISTTSQTKTMTAGGAGCGGGKVGERLLLQRGVHTLFVNAAVSGRRDLPRQPGWLVELDLPRAGRKGE